MRKLFIAALLCFGVLYLLPSCQQPGASFQTKEDSLKFAKAYFDLYPNDNSVVTKWNSDSGSSSAVQPINWDEVLRYKEQYDKHPLIYNIKGEALKGFLVDANGYSQIKGNNDIKGLYLRLARKDDGAFTIMLLGTDETGRVIGENKAQMRSAEDSAKDSDFDNVDPCPASCPPNFE